MATGPEYMLKALGIDPKQIEKVIGEIVDGIRTNNARLARLEIMLAEIHAAQVQPTQNTGQLPLTLEDQSNVKSTVSETA